MEGEKVNHSERLQQQHDVGKVSPLDLWHCRR